MLRWSKIRKKDIANGPGTRVSIWVQGCPFKCKGCFNQNTWDPNAGHVLGEKVTKQLIELGNNPDIVGYSILGGEPLLNCNDMLQLIQLIRNTYPDKTIWMWTGYKYENLNEQQMKIINLIDVLVDGQFIEELKDPSLKFRGSSNQRLIDIKQTLANNKITILKEG
jgi:anaerobic ribonucleoside-triphosphate reductase activating protein